MLLLSVLCHVVPYGFGYVVKVCLLCAAKGGYAAGWYQGCLSSAPVIHSGTRNKPFKYVGLVQFYPLLVGQCRAPGGLMK